MRIPYETELAIRDASPHHRPPIASCFKTTQFRWRKTRTEGDEDFRLHCAALEWSLAEPIIINSADDIKSSVDWKDRVDPYSHQVQNLMRFCRRLPETLLADDVGLGKTISAGLILSELLKRSRVSKVLVICPKILIPQWIEELDSKFGIAAYGAVGSEVRSARNRTEPVSVTSYQSATAFLAEQHSGLFDMLILDEAHKVRNLHGTQSRPKIAARFIVRSKLDCSNTF